VTTRTSPGTARLGRSRSGAARPGTIRPGTIRPDTAPPGTGTGRIDATRWPDVAVAAGSPVRAVVARAVFTNAVTRLPLRVRFPDGHAIGGGGADSPVMVLRRPREFYRRFGASGLIGFGEAYMAGDWDSEDLTALLVVLAEHAAELVPPWLQRLRRLAVRRHPGEDLQTVAGARRNIGRHYDLSNDLFALFLDETMTYSSAIFTDPDGIGAMDPLAEARFLAEAQHRKIDRLLDRAGVGRGSRVLEIGTGWGELAIRAARRGATVHTVTISREQAELATRRITEAGLAAQVRVDLCDYRDVEGQFDAICSVEMIEAVGDRYWDTFFTALDQHLAPGGRIGLQTITMAHDRMLATRHTYTWIQKYIFPGGLLPSVTAIGDSLSRTRLRIVAREDFGAHYAETLKLWRERFGAHAGEVARLGFDDVFRRMWNFYLSYTEAGFRAGYIDVSQLTLARI
jgi:cyclopropane-fatty-acyl-phospholipid synthase